MEFDVAKFSKLNDRFSEILQSSEGTFRNKDIAGSKLKVGELRSAYNDMQGMVNDAIEKLSPDEQLDLEVARSLPKKHFDEEAKSRSSAGDMEGADRLLRMKTLSITQDNILPNLKEQVSNVEERVCLRERQAYLSDPSNNVPSISKCTI